MKNRTCNGKTPTRKRHLIPQKEYNRIDSHDRSEYTKQSGREDIGCIGLELVEFFLGKLSLHGRLGIGWSVRIVVGLHRLKSQVNLKAERQLSQYSSRRCSLTQWKVTFKQFPFFRFANTLDSSLENNRLGR